MVHYHFNMTHEREVSNDSNASSSPKLKTKYPASADSVPTERQTFNTGMPSSPKQEGAENITLFYHNNYVRQCVPCTKTTRIINTSNQSDSNNSRSNIDQVRGISLLRDTSQNLLSFLSRDISPSSPTSTTATERLSYTTSPSYAPDSFLLPQF
mmetsp:Transcript_6339/g.9210  ORF Transcript_6339/g.9210 Transcript_6339/m.9210 type:complete len:154 (+) Transcript_6339:135-596(+)